MNNKTELLLKKKERKTLRQQIYSKTGRM